MTLEKYKTLQDLEKEILKPDTDMDVTTLYNSRGFQGLPATRQDHLMTLLARGTPTKNAIKIGNKIIEDSFTLSGYMPDEKDTARTLFRDSIANIEDPSEILKSARQIAKDVGGGDYTGLPKATPEPKSKDKGKEKPKEKVPVYDPTTGTFK